MTASDDYHILGDFVMNILIVAVLRRTTAGRSSRDQYIVIYSDIGRPAICVFDYCSRTFRSKKQRIWSPNQQNHQQFCSATMLCSAVVSLFLPFLFFFDSFLREREGVTITTTTYHLLNVYSVIEFNPRYYHIPYRN